MFVYMHVDPKLFQVFACFNFLYSFMVIQMFGDIDLCDQSHLMGNGAR